MYELIKTLPYWLQISLLLVPILSFLIAASAFVISARKTTLTNKLERAKIVSECLHTFMDDDMMRTAFYRIEYNRFKYDNGFHTSNEEREIDKLLRHFSNLAMMWENGLVNLEDIRSVQYFILRTVNNLEIGKYLSFIEDWSAYNGTGIHPYSALKKLAKSLNSEVAAYHKNLI